MALIASPRLETERLILRPPKEADFEDWAAAHADPDAMRFTYGDPQSRDDAWRIMAMVLGHWTMRGYGFYSVLEKASGRWVGRVGPWCPEGWPRPEVGWLIAAPFQRRGFALEASRVCMDHVVDDMGWDRVGHLILEDNAPSQAVAKALGSRPEEAIADFRGRGSARMWGQRAEDWRAQRKV